MDPPAPSSDGSQPQGSQTDIPVASLAQPKAVVDDLPADFQNVAAKGGAVAAVTLGLLATFGAFVTVWSIFNAIVGGLLGIWGLNSPLKKTAGTGVVLCIAGLLLCLFFAISQ